MGLHTKAEKILSKSDPILGKIITLSGACTLKPELAVSPYESLLRSIVYQQLHGKAAATILQRYLDLFPTRGIPKPDAVLKKRVATMRACGLSEAKALAIKDLALKTRDGVVPSTKEIQKLSDEEILERLTQIRGIGVWTVQMMLMFKLGRPDVMPSTDFGVQKGYSLAYKKPHPTPKVLAVYGEAHWMPYRSIASWYMWRAVDLMKSKSGRG